MVEALQVFVRKFQSRERGDEIVNVLEDLGFHVKECFDGDNDSLGGLIETYIASEDDLLTSDLNEIANRVARNPDIFVQFRRYELIDEGRCSADSSSVIPLRIVE